MAGGAGADVRVIGLRCKGEQENVGFGLAHTQMARGLGRAEDVEKYVDSSGNWRNLFRPNQTSAFANGSDTGFVGFFQPRFLNETWDFQDPLWCSNMDTSNRECSLTVGAKETFESSIWEYS